MKRYLVFFSVHSLLCKDLVVLSLPRSGTGYFQKIVSLSTKWDYQDYRDVWTLKKENQRVCGEIFGYWFKFFEYESKNIFDTPVKKDFDDIYYNKWKKIGRLKFTKEIAFFLYVPFFEKYFNVISLLRDRKHTFPTTLQWVFLALYSNFVNCRNGDKKIALLQKYCLKEKRTLLQQQIFAHIISSYLLLRDIEKFQLPILKWDKLMRLSGENLKKYLEKSLPKEYDASLFAYNIEQTRINRLGYILTLGKWFPIKYYFNYWVYGKDLLDVREERYKALNVEQDCQKLIDYIQEIDPEFTYIKYLR